MRSLLSSPEERHAFVIGLCEVLCPWPARYSVNSRNSINSEYHYYVSGRALGVIAWLIIAKIIQEVFF